MFRPFGFVVVMDITHSPSYYFYLRPLTPTNSTFTSKDDPDKLHIHFKMALANFNFNLGPDIRPEVDVEVAMVVSCPGSVFGRRRSL